MKITASCLSMSLTLLLAACGSNPPPPDWQSNAHGALQSFTSAYLTGNSRVADLEFARARNEIASTGRADLLARAELVRCAARAASLELDNCTGFQPLAQDADAGDRNYAAYLNGQWQGLDANLLPQQYRALVSASAASADKSRLDDIKDPLSRLVAAAALLQNGRLTPAEIVAATETASAQGWRRPLLAWLGVQAQRAQTAGDRDAETKIRRRMDLVSKPLP